MCPYIKSLKAYTHDVLERIIESSSHTACPQWLFVQNAIQVQPHGGKNPIALYQEMWLRMLLHVSMQPPCNGSRPCNVSKLR